MKLFNLTMSCKADNIKTVLFTLLAAVCMLTGMDLHAFNMRQISNSDGLSNSAILSLCLDHNGYLWAGTCDGVNIYDGTTVYPFQTLYPDQQLSGNIIENIERGGEGEMWVLTNYGLDLVDTDSGSVTSFPQFHGQELICSSERGDLFVMTEDSRLFMYNTLRDSDFVDMGTITSSDGSIVCITVREGKLWAVTPVSVDIYDIDTLSDKSTPHLKPDRHISNFQSVFVKARGEDLYIITPEGDLRSIGTDGSSRTVANISGELQKRGRISSIVNDHQGNYFVSFSTDGVLWVGRDERGEFVPVDLGLHVGVFCLEASATQDVVWIGSDCQGIYTYWDDQYSVRAYDFNRFGNILSRPVRTIFLDGRRNLWVGTKGDGLLMIPGVDEYNPGPALEKGVLFTSSNSGLSHNSVFSLSKSSGDRLWVGTDGGVDYYDYRDGRLHHLRLPEDVDNIHDIYEANDSTLWLASLGGGVVRVDLKKGGAAPEVRNVERFALENGRVSANQFFTITVDGKGDILFCNRGRGMWEVKNGKLVSLPLKDDLGVNAVSDVFTALSDKEALWLGTGLGLVKSTPEGVECYRGAENGFANNTIHDMIRTVDGDIWMSTNNGITRFNPGGGKSETYGKNYGLNVTEYSDGAAFDTGNTLIFGGINGLTFVYKRTDYTPADSYMPPLSPLKLTVAGHDEPIGRYLRRGRGGETLTMDADQNNFSVTIAAPDFINGHSYVYSYSIDGGDWINLGSDPTVAFNELPYGKYDLKVKYTNLATGMESEPYGLRITVKAPWYLSGWAKAIYLLIVIAAAAAGVMLYLRRQRERQTEELAKLEQTHREEVYEEKLRFFTNITHEFCTPLTLIYGPCERLLDYKGTDAYIRRFVGLIRSNAERLNTLIQELIDFRRMETGHKQLKPCEVGVSHLCSDIMVSFSELADRNRIEFIDDIHPDIVWPSDFGCIRKIMTNLISNAFKYTPDGGTIRVGVREESGKLQMSVYNTGKGISEEERKRIFNRYSVLDNVEENAVKGLSSRNGLGLAICHSMVDLLDGRIDIESEKGKYAEFIVELPPLDIPEPEPLETPAVKSEPKAAPAPAEQAAVEEPKTDDIVEAEPEEGSAERPDEATVSDTEKIPLLVVDDNPEILVLLRDTLSDYKVMTAMTAEEALEILKNTPPELIISDIMMPGTDGVTFTKMVKQNKHTMHIPLILLSAKTSNEERIEGITSGADAYIGKPFSLSYLIAVVNRLLENKRHMREYYNTSASAYGFQSGKLVHREDKDFLEGVIAFIEEHVDDNDLGPELLATHMKISVRNLYRKFKELDQLSPNDFIKYQRISHAAKLLETTSITVQEIVYRSGFNNRSHFYKEFDKRFGMTPKDYRLSKSSPDKSLTS